MSLLATLCHPTTVQGGDDPDQAMLGQTSGDFSFPGYPALNHGTHRGAEESVKPWQIPTVSVCCHTPKGKAGGLCLSGSPAKLACSTPGCTGMARALPVIGPVAALTFHLPKAGGVKSIPSSPFSPSLLFRKQGNG